MTALLIVALSVALIWGAVIFIRGGLLGGCLLVLLAGACFGHPFFNMPLGPLPITADRLLWGILLAQYLIWNRAGLTARRPLGNAELVLCLFFGLLLASTFSHDWRADHNQALAKLLFHYLMPLGMYWVARQIRFSERGFLGLLGCLAGFGIYLAITGLAETGGAWWLVYPKYIVSAEYQEFMGRARGPLLNPAGSGVLLGVCLCSVLLWWPRLNRVGQLLLLSAAVLMCLGVYSTYTRTAWMGAGFGLFILLALSIPKSWRLPVLGSSVLLVALAGATQWERILAFKRDRDLSAAAAAESVKLRPILAVVAWKMFLDRPLLGCGFSQYAEEKDAYLSDRSARLQLEKVRPFAQHNVFLSLLVEMGLLGMGSYVLLLAIWTRDAWRVWRSRAAPPWARQMTLLFFVLLANYLVNGMFQDVSLIPMVNMLLFFLAGITAGLRSYGCNPTPTTRPL